MKLKINVKAAVFAAVNILLLGGALIFSVSGNHQSQEQSQNYAAERWENGSSSENYSQLSVFLSDNSGFTTDMLGTARSGILNALQAVSIAPKEGQKLVPDAYSSPAGTATVRGDSAGYSEAEITAVGGDFFLFRDFTLLDGAFFSDDDIMQDGVVIDRDLAWSLYGSHEIAGMYLTINNVRFYISGVIDTPDTDEEKLCRGEYSQAYISYDGASNIAAVSGMSGDFSAMGDGSEGISGFKKITCYEVLMPDPVSGFAKTSFENLMMGRECEIIVNTDRFKAAKRLKALKTISQTAVRKTGVSYPYWENASRITEMKLSFTYLWMLLCLIIPAVTAIWLIIKGAGLAKKYVLMGVNLVLELIEKRKLRKWREKNEQKETQ